MGLEAPGGVCGVRRRPRGVQCHGGFVKGVHGALTSMVRCPNVTAHLVLEAGTRERSWVHKWGDGVEKLSSLGFGVPGVPNPVSSLHKGLHCQG